MIWVILEASIVSCLKSDWTHKQKLQAKAYHYARMPATMP